MLADKITRWQDREREYNYKVKYHIQATNYKFQTYKLSTADNLQASSPNIEDQQS